MSSINRAILIGNVGKDPEVRHMTLGDKVGMFSLATTESWKDKATGQQKQRTEWHNVVVFNDRLVSLLEQYIKKGTKLYVEGQVQTRSYPDQSGKNVYITEIVLQKFKGEIIMLSKNEEKEASEQDPGYQVPEKKPEFTPHQYQGKIIDDEIPF